MQLSLLPVDYKLSEVTALRKKVQKR